MNTSHLSAQRLRNLQLLATLAAGICIAMLGHFLLDAFILMGQPLSPPTWRDYGAAASRIASAVLVIVIGYRLVRRSTLPGVLTIAVLMALLWTNLLLGR